MSINKELPDNYIVFDLETTGLAHNSEIIEIGALKVENDEIKEVFEEFIKPTCHIPEIASSVNGITDDMVQDSAPAETVLKKFAGFIENSVLVGHNAASFDIIILKNNMSRFINTEITNQIIDTLHIARKRLSLPDYKLSTICEYFSIENNKAHRALSDTIATYKCFLELKKCEDMPKSEIPMKSRKKYKINYTEESQALQILNGILFGVTCDGVLTENEVYAVKKWLDDYEYLAGNYPFDRVHNEISKALSDGILERHELDSLLNTFLEVIDPAASRHDDTDSISVSEKVVCLTGDFITGSKDEVTYLLSEMGASVSKSVTRKTNILIVGGMGSEAWKFGTYGGKIKQAMELQEKGFAIKIINENEIFDLRETKEYV